MINKTYYMIDTTRGPVHKVRYSIDWRWLLSFLAIAALIVAMVSFVVSAYEPPTIEVHCTNAGILVFQEIGTNNYLAYVKLANEEQLKEIKKLNVAVDPSVEDFKLCHTEVQKFEIRLDGELVFVHADGVIPPANYNYELTKDEEAAMLNSSCEEVQYLYWELSRIFKTNS